MSFTNDRFGTANSALLFTNPSSYLVTTVEQPASDVFSICLWFRIPADSGGGELIQLNSGRTGGDTDKMLQVLPNGILNFYLYPGSQVYLPTPSTVNDGNWHQTAATLSAAGMNLFLDGQLVASNTNVTTSQGFSGYWRLATGWSGSPTAGGALDSVRIYNRALSSSEVQQLYSFESLPLVTLKKAVKPSFSNLYLGTNYQLQVSTDLKAWVNSGSAFTPTNTIMDYPQYFDVDEWSELFFRVQPTP